MNMNGEVVVGMAVRADREVDHTRSDGGRIVYKRGQEYVDVAVHDGERIRVLSFKVQADEMQTEHRAPTKYEQRTADAVRREFGVT